MQQKRLEVELHQTYRVYYPHVSKKLFALCNFLITFGASLKTKLGNR